jgi:hypothetical protein
LPALLIIVFPQMGTWVFLAADTVLTLLIGSAFRYALRADLIEIRVTGAGAARSRTVSGTLEVRLARGGNVNTATPNTEGVDTTRQNGRTKRATRLAIRCGNQNHGSLRRSNTRRRTIKTSVVRGVVVIVKGRALKSRNTRRCE